jgi:hypothetical protein
MLSARLLGTAGLDLPPQTRPAPSISVPGRGSGIEDLLQHLTLRAPAPTPILILRASTTMIQATIRTQAMPGQSISNKDGLSTRLPGLLYRTRVTPLKG